MKILNTRIIALFLFLLSGGCALIYEVVWSKYLAIFIGSTAYSHMIVLATYMGGLALGTLIIGKYSDKVSNRLQLYGLLELGIGAYCLAYPFIAGVVGNIFITLASSFGGTSQKGVLLFLKLILSFISLILPTILMGGTLPVLTKFLSKSITDSGKNVAILYSINSMGAVIGTAVAGFFLIRSQGLDNTVWLVSLLNILIGLSAFILSKYDKTNVQPKIITRGEAIVQNLEISEPAIRIGIITAFASGVVTMLYELVWIRLLSNILGSSTYSFTVMLIAFISGIAIGSFIISLVITKIKNVIAFLAICQFGTAASMILTLPLYERLPYYLVKVSAIIPNQPEYFPAYISLEYLFCFLIMLVPTIFSGMSLPLVSRIANKDISFLGKSIGTIFSVNTIGSVTGVLLGGLVIIPLLGLKQSLECGVLLNAFLGLYILYNTGLSHKTQLALTIFFVLIGIGNRILFPSWNENIFISGVFRNLYTQSVPSYSDFIKQQTEGQKILWYEEGIDANVAVRESIFGDTIQKTLVINGKADASTIADLQTQILLGHIPLMLYPNTGAALVIGLGSGITCGSVLRHPVKSLDVVEIASEVVECNSFFTRENYSFITDARVKIYIDDAITQLKTTSTNYDYIISEPSNPWIAGIGNLYSQDFFNLCKVRLKSDGVLTQWFHTYDVSNEIFTMVLKTISEVFPFVTIWKVAESDVIILASANPVAISYEAMESKMNQPSIAQDLARINMHDVYTLLSTQVVSARNNPFKYSTSELNTANKPLLEFIAPIALFTHESVTVLDSLDERFSFKDSNLLFSEYEKQRPLTFENFMNIARFRSTYHTGDVAIAYTALKKSLELAPDNEEALSMIARVTADLGLPDGSIRKSQLEEIRLTYELNKNDISAVFGYLHALVEYYRNENSIVNPQKMNDAVELMKKAIHDFPDEVDRFQYILAMIFTGAGRYDEAAKTFENMVNIQNPNGTGSSIRSSKELVYNIGESYYNAGNLVEAEKYIELLKSIDPTNDKLVVMKNKITMKKSGIK